MYLLAEAIFEEGELLFFAGILMFIGVLFRRQMRRKKRKVKRQSPKTQVQEMKKSWDSGASRVGRPLRDAPPEILRWQTEMFDVARELKAEVDTKVALLQSASRLAAEQAQRLELAVERAHQLGLTADRSPLEQIDYLSQQLASGEADLASGPIKGPFFESRSKNREIVLAYYQQGLSPQEIANQTGIAIGEVELTLSSR